MEYALLGRSGLKVSRLALGTMNFGAGPGAPCDEPEARRIIDAFLDRGGNVIDTADIYTGGRSEEVVGRAIAARRDSVVLATKGAGPLGPGPNDRGLSRRHLSRALDASLRRLGTDHVDLYQCHNWDPDVPVEETMTTLDGFVRQGKVRYIGCSNYTASQIIESQWASQRLGTTPFVSLQPHYSLLAREIEAEILPACARHGLGAIAYGPLAGGVLAGRYRRGAQPAPGSRLHQWLAFNPTAARWAATLLRDRSFDIADGVTEVADHLATTPSAVAITWALRRPGITSVILGPRTIDQLTDNLASLDLDLPTDLAARLDDLSAPPNRPVTGLPVTLQEER
ncbi:aldo/keto reductase [Frankia sp. CcI49]|uniref:aldo/keto reductase n=1 Tax=Frankia sp. CcI49 TaxID=1745382 RepID=UPI000977B6DD|nr:aldo/keto reductase [Frankia sp. CcI49]ONH52508.1 aldo/keto reductase [Frankia sp. CcI49]